MFKKIIRPVILCIIFTLVISVIVNAQDMASQTIIYPDPEYIEFESDTFRAFRPKSVTFIVNAYDDDESSTTLRFTLGSNATNAINEHFNPDEKYFGVDIKNVPDTNAREKMDAKSWSSTLPNPYFDTDRSTYRYEAEVHTEENVQANYQYFFNVVWNDYRDGTASSGGGFKSNCEISTLWAYGEYNVHLWLPLATQYYSPNPGIVVED